jgi:ASC-1-like (ASCH) protein
MYGKEHHMKLNEESYDKISSGKKVIEVRLYDDKRKDIRIGDIITFTCEHSRRAAPHAEPDTKMIKTKVMGLLRYDSFEDLVDDHEPKLFGEESGDELKKKIYSIYSKEQENGNGVLGMRVQKIDSI